MLRADDRHWHANADDTVTCTACYRNCRLADGETGWCKVRTHRHGQLQLDAPNVITGAGYGPSSRMWWFRTFRPYLHLAGLACTSGCTFCASTDVALHPERIPWADRPPTVPFAGQKIVTDPALIVEQARRLNVDYLYLGTNEPTLMVEFTAALFTLAKRAGLRTAMSTNGFCSEAIIRQLAPVTDAVDLGVKGSGDPEFYAKRMRAPGAFEQVKQSMQAWYAAGVPMVISNVIAPPQWMDNATWDAATTALYRWIVEHLDPTVPVDLRPMFRSNHRHGLAGPTPRPLIAKGPADEVADREAAFMQRVDRTVELARAAGCAYVMLETPEVLGRTRQPTIRCHRCGEVLMRLDWRGTISGIKVMLTERAGLPLGYGSWHFVKHDSTCGHCGARVPIVP